MPFGLVEYDGNRIIPGGVDKGVLLALAVWFL